MGLLDHYLQSGLLKVVDPNACYQEWVKAVKAGDVREALQYHSALAAWIRNGGFEPKWHATARNDFLSWKVL